MARRKMRGKQLQAAIIDLAHTYGWHVAHFQSVLATRKDGSASWRTPVAADGKGFPDLLLVRKNRVLAIEVKGDGDKLRPEQRQWIEWLCDAGVQVIVATPIAWFDGTILEVVSRHPRHVTTVEGVFGDS